MGAEAIMISINRTGQYKLIETKHNTKILYLNDTAYAWIESKTAGDILVLAEHLSQEDHTFVMGVFILYEVDSEPYLSDLPHLELEIGNKMWQGYLLPTGLPSANKKRSVIIPTHEVITNNQRFTRNKRSKDKLKHE